MKETKLTWGIVAFFVTALVISAVLLGITATMPWSAYEPWTTFRMAAVVCLTVIIVVNTCILYIDAKRRF